jgi:phosphoribosylformylglycinamidine synthase
MAKKVKVIILRTAGTNCDQETAFAFKHFGADVDLVHINRVLKKQVQLNDYHILAIPGGFTYGDDLESGRILANEIRLHLGEPLCKFLGQKKLVIGICNGFQVLVKAGILPGASNENDDHKINQTATLFNNDSGKFEDRWIHLKVSGKSVWTKGVKEIVYLPVAHAEGKFVSLNQKILQDLKSNGQVAFHYCSSDGQKPKYPENPNGSMDDIAGITDRTGRVLGLMPHPERHFLFTHHPSWTRLAKKSSYGDGAMIFQNGIEYAQNHLF